MILLDDLLLRPFVTVLDSLHSIALHEMYDVEEIQNGIKENRLLYEIGERPREEYERRRDRLEEELEIAERAHEQLRSGKIEVKH